MKTDMLLTTASLVGEQRIVAHLGIGIRDIVGGRSAGKRAIALEKRKIPRCGR